MADILSILAMTYSSTDRQALKYRLMGSREPVDSWGHEYVRYSLMYNTHVSLLIGLYRQLASEIIPEFNERRLKDENVNELTSLIDAIVPFCLSHNAEADACDLLLETEQLDKLPSHVDALTFSRVCLYLVRYVGNLTGLLRSSINASKLCEVCRNPR